jgi:hypothetical protein
MKSLLTLLFLFFIQILTLTLFTYFIAHFLEPLQEFIQHLLLVSLKIRKSFRASLFSVIISSIITTVDIAIFVALLPPHSSLKRDHIILTLTLLSLYLNLISFAA